MHEFTFEGSGIRSEQQRNEVLLLARPHTHVKCGPCHFGVYLTHRLVTPWPTHPSQLHTGLVLPFTHAPASWKTLSLISLSLLDLHVPLLWYLSYLLISWRKYLRISPHASHWYPKKPLKYIYFIFKSKLRNYLWRLILTWFCRTQKMATKV